MHDLLAQAHDSAKAQFDKLAEARGTLDKARVELDSLSRLGDMVTQEDVIKGAGKLVAAGLSPMAVAKLLSDMPEQGQQLAAWVQNHVQQLTAREAQLGPVLEQARHSLGVSAMRSLMLHTLVPRAGQGPAQASAGAPGPSGNSLLPQQTIIESTAPGSASE